MNDAGNKPGPLAEERFLKPADIAPLLGVKYSETARAGFWRAVRRAGVPFIRVNDRKMVFEESAVRAWMDSRRVGKAGAA